MLGWGRFVLGLGAASFFGFGLAFLIAPLELYAALGLTLSGAVAATELMAFYGGLEVALGALIAGCARGHARVRDGLLLMSSCYGGIALARAVGMAATGARSEFLWFALAAEATLALAALALWIALRAPVPDAS